MADATHTTYTPPISGLSSAVRTITALIIREISTTYGRSSMGYLWAILEPVAGIMVLTAIFSVSFHAPPIGKEFALFYASGILPFMAYTSISQKISVSLRFSRPLLFYPGVLFIDAILARLLLNSVTQIIVIFLVLAFIFGFYAIDLAVDFPVLALTLAMTFSLAFGIGTLNCFLLSRYPIWERAWAILNRPLFIISCVFFMFDNVPMPYKDYLLWNPLVHIVGQMRAGIYTTYDASYVSPLYVFGISLTTLALGLLFLRRYYRDIVNDE